MNKDLKYWLAINRLPKMGPVTIKRLWERFGSIQAVWHASQKDLLETEGINRIAIGSFLEWRARIDLEDERTAIEEKGIKALTLEDEGYPELLKNIYDPPPVLYVRGQGLSNREKYLAVVGTRKASLYGRETAERLAAELSGLGFTIVSGMALGIDSAAHQGALRAGGRTVAVFGCGVDRIFPAENLELSKIIQKSGALISEFPLGYPADRSTFPRRNRIISGLSMGVIVVEGHYESGAMITAKCALDQGREVFAIPGNVTLEQSKGPHWLIKQGAKLVESVKDVLEEFDLVVPEQRTQNTEHRAQEHLNLPPDQRKLISVLSLEPKHIDLISVECGFSIAQASSLLMLLEIKKIIRQLPGKNFVLF